MLTGRTASLCGRLERSGCGLAAAGGLCEATAASASRSRRRRPEPREPAERAPVVPSLVEGRRALPEAVEPLDPLELAAFDPIMTSPTVREEQIQRRIDWWLEYWRGRSTAPFQRGLARMGQYQDFVNAELAKRGLPE